VELVYVYVSEHKILTEFGASFSSNYIVKLTNWNITILKKTATIDYYNGLNIKAIVGKNGSGKSSLLDFIEESCSPYTESRGFVIWYDSQSDEFIVHDVNRVLNEYSLDFCLDYKIIDDNSRFLKRRNYKIYKVNSLSSTELFSFQSRKRNVIDYSIGNQNKFRGVKRTVNLQRLLNFFNNSQWLINKQANYTYTFYFKTPSTSIRKWVERILNGAKESVNVDGSKSNDGQYGIDLNFFPNIFDDFEISLRSIFQNLVMRNIFSFIKMFPSLRIGNSEYTNAFCLYFIEKKFFQERLTSNIFVECLIEFNQMWESQSNARSYNFDIQYVRFLCQRFFDSMRTISEITCASVDRRYLKNGDAFSTNDYNSIISMLDGLSSLHPGLASNFKYGWEGFSTGEFAKLNIFSSLFNIIQEGGVKGLIVIDEIDLFLHPEWQRTLISELISFYNDYKNVSDLQFIITTHSPLIIGDLLPEDIISLYINDDGIPERTESFGFGTEITDAYVSGMHIKSTFGEHSRKKLVELIDKKVTNDLDANDKLLAAKISNKELKKRLLDD